MSGFYRAALADTKCRVRPQTSKVGIGDLGRKLLGGVGEKGEDDNLRASESENDLCELPGEVVEKAGQEDPEDEDDSSGDEEAEIMGAEPVPPEIVMEEAQEALEESDADEPLQGEQAEVKIKRPVNPADPKPKEVEEHWAKGHMPFKPWCPVCIKSRGKEDPHYADTKKEREEKGLPRISIDYAEVGNGEDREDTRKLLVGRDRWTKTTFCHLVQCKGLGDTRIIWLKSGRV